MSKQIPTTLRTAVLLLALLTAPACAGFRAQACIDPRLTPAQKAHAAEVARLREIQRGAEMTKRVGELLVSLSNAEVALTQMGRIDRERHLVAQTYFGLTGDVVLVALENAKDHTKPADQRLNGLAAALKAIDGLKTAIVDKLPDPDARTQLGLIVSMVQSLLMTWQWTSGG